MVHRAPGGSRYGAIEEPNRKPPQSLRGAERGPRPRGRAKKPAKRATTVEGRCANEAVLAVFAHDIRTALTGILALGELLASSNLGERERRWAIGIKVGAEHLASLTTLVIDAAKADAGSLTLQQEIFRPRAHRPRRCGNAHGARGDQGPASGDGMSPTICRRCWSAIRCGCARRWKTSSTMR